MTALTWPPRYGMLTAQFAVRFPRRKVCVKLRMMVLIAGRTSLSGSEGSRGTVPVEFDKDPTAKLESIGEAEYDRGSSSWLIAGRVSPTRAIAARALSHSPTERTIFRHCLARNRGSTTLESTTFQPYGRLPRDILDSLGASPRRAADTASAICVMSASATILPPITNVGVPSTPSASARPLFAASLRAIAASFIDRKSVV